MKQPLLTSAAPPKPVIAPQEEGDQSTRCSFNDFGLCSDILRAINKQGYDKPTPIQAKSIPHVLSGADVLAAAQTGTGKTAAFTLPLLQRLSDKKSRSKAGKPVKPSALILTPTRELASQIGENLAHYSLFLDLRSETVFGGVKIEGQIKRLSKGVDILVATPGRLLDLSARRVIDLSSISILVLDEADRMLDMGFIHDIKKVLKLLPVARQNLLFSATFSDEIKRLSRTILVDPVEVQVGSKNRTVDVVTQLVHPVNQSRKRALLSHLIGTKDLSRVLVFTRTKHGANRLAKQLESDGFPARAIHGNKSQNQRTKALSEFKDGRVKVLVATDIAARGLHIDELSHVVNFDLPNVAEDYVHRIGRTGRAGHIGTAISLVSSVERKLLEGIHRFTRSKIPSEVVVGFEPFDEPEAPIMTRGSGRGGAAGTRAARSSSSSGSGGKGRRHQGRSSSSPTASSRAKGSTSSEISVTRRKRPAHKKTTGNRLSSKSN